MQDHDEIYLEIGVESPWPFFTAAQEAANALQVVTLSVKVRIDLIDLLSIENSLNWNMKKTRRNEEN